MSADDRSAEILDRLRRLRARDAPTHGGRTLAYVYDSGVAELDELAARAAEIARPLNGLDPTAFPSIAAMERDLIAFARRALHGDSRRARAFGSVTSGGTESCLLAVKTARDLWRAADPLRARSRPRLVAPVTAHAAFQKAARLFDLEWDPVPCAADGTVSADEMIRRLSADVALVVVSAPAYPSGALDPVGRVAAAAADRGISCHVDACFGGLVLPWWPGLPAWDFRVRGVTSISADLHKFGYAPKGVSVLLHRGRARHRAQFFATTRWPGYPVVNPTLLGSRSASPTAAAWAIAQRLGDRGYAELTARCVRATRSIVAAADRIEGLAVQGRPAGPAVALIADPAVPAAARVDPHLLADEVARLEFRIQHQPGLVQSNGVRLPHSAHLTITPVTERTLPELLDVLARAADAVRGRPRPEPRAELAALRMLGYGSGSRSGSRVRVPGPRAAWRILRAAGVRVDAGGLPERLAPLMALAERLPAPVAEALLTELLARVSEP
ncbi:pyridoxal phosphate-dependent decarboxylase family protein [Leucobacter triazinivorans]|uniref:Aspartate aminotransferase family protein n=1 Tax=Leucobacter triazinivorans TaxID=1784719 RepID=A0A4P6KD74_9MICO|nr:aminotransferase class V-fold PLP-dependent enzyme [Leucobacter triazinivorans]QBE48335.1 aspartate aminotransferase family protein [Leucobacter triazinivorans]